MKAWKRNWASARLFITVRWKQVREILTRSVAEDEPLTSPNLSAQERMRKAIESVRGTWADRGTTDEWMRASRADDSDDAYTGR